MLKRESEKIEMISTKWHKRGWEKIIQMKFRKKSLIKIKTKWYVEKREWKTKWSKWNVDWWCWKKWIGRNEMWKKEFEKSEIIETNCWKEVEKTERITTKQLNNGVEKSKVIEMKWWKKIVKTEWSEWYSKKPMLKR